MQYNEGGYTIQIHNQPLYIVTQDVRAQTLISVDLIYIYIILIDRCAHRRWATLLPNQTAYNIASWKQWGLFRVSYRDYYFLGQKCSCLIPTRIYTADNHLFQYNGGEITPNSTAKVPNEVTAEKIQNVTSPLWIFQGSGDLPTSTPYSVSYLYILITRRFQDWGMV